MAFPRNGFFITSMSLAACSPQSQSADNASAPAQPVAQSNSAKIATPPVKPTVVLARNFEPGAIQTGKPLPRKRIVLKRGQRIDVLDDKGTTSFVGPVTIGPDGETISGGSGQEGGQGFGSVGKRIIDIGGVRIESASPAASAPMPPPPVMPDPMPVPTGNQPQ